MTRPSERDPNWRKRPRWWTPPRVYRLTEMLSNGKSDAQIAKALGTSPEAVNLYRKRHGIKPRTRIHLTTRDVAELLGFGCSKKVAWLIDMGALKASWLADGQGRSGCRSITRMALMDFLENPDHWHLWAWERITDPFLRKRMQSLRGHVRYLTQGEIAERYFVQVETVGQWLEKGWIPYRRIGRGNKVVDERDLASFDPPGIGGNWARRWEEKRRHAA